MGKVIRFIDYKQSKEEKLNLNCKEEPEDIYLESLINMTEEDIRMIEELENN